MQAVYQLKITLKHVVPPVWRRVLVPEDFTLAQLHRLIQAAMGWSDSHLHEFVGLRGGGRRRFMPAAVIEDMDEFDAVDEGAVLMREVLSQPKDRLRYFYDFGDAWSHDITLEKLLKTGPDTRAPSCL